MSQIQLNLKILTVLWAIKLLGSCTFIFLKFIKMASWIIQQCIVSSLWDYVVRVEMLDYFLWGYQTIQVYKNSRQPIPKLPDAIIWVNGERGPELCQNFFSQSLLNTKHLWNCKKKTLLWPHFFQILALHLEVLWILTNCFPPV